MARLALLALGLILALVTQPSNARAADVDVALVLVTDVSRSIDDSEFALEKNGYARAFTARPAGARQRRNVRASASHEPGSPSRCGVRSSWPLGEKLQVSRH